MIGQGRYEGGTHHHGCRISSDRWDPSPVLDDTYRASGTWQPYRTTIMSSRNSLTNMNPLPPLPKNPNEDNLYEYITTNMPGILFPSPPSLKILCVAAVANASRSKNDLTRKLKRVGDPSLFRIYNTQVNTCELPNKPHMTVWPYWTAYPTLLVRKRNFPATRNGRHYVPKRQCVTCWLREPEPCEPFSMFFQTTAADMSSQ